MKTFKEFLAESKIKTRKKELNGFSILTKKYTEMFQDELAKQYGSKPKLKYPISCSLRNSRIDFEISDNKDLDKKLKECFKNAVNKVLSIILKTEGIKVEERGNPWSDIFSTLRAAFFIRSYPEKLDNTTTEEDEEYTDFSGEVKKIRKIIKSSCDDYIKLNSDKNSERIRYGGVDFDGGDEEPDDINYCYFYVKPPRGKYFNNEEDVIDFQEDIVWNAIKPAFEKAGIKNLKIDHRHSHVDDDVSTLVLKYKLPKDF